MASTNRRIGQDQGPLGIGQARCIGLGTARKLRAGGRVHMGHLEGRQTPSERAEPPPLNSFQPS
jgi:hypothetical protein